MRQDSFQPLQYSFIYLNIYIYHCIIYSDEIISSKSRNDMSGIGVA